MSARCLRCGAGNEWIEGVATLKAEPDDEAVRLVVDYYGGFPMGRLGARARDYLERKGVLTKEGTLSDAYLSRKEQR